MKDIPTCNSTVDDGPMKRIKQFCQSSALSLKAVLCEALITIFNIVTTLVMLPILCMFLAWKLLVIAIAWVVWKDEVTVMRGQDTSYTVGPNSTLKTTTVIAWLLVDGAVLTRSNVVQMLEANVIYSHTPEIRKLYRRFTQHVMSFMGIHFWKDIVPHAPAAISSRNTPNSQQTYDIGAHVHYLHRSEGLIVVDLGNTSGPRQIKYKNSTGLSDLTTEIANMGEPFDIYNGSKSPWEVFCVPREDGQECAVIFKFHHCLMDAAGFSVLLSDMFLDERLAGLGGAQRAKNCAERWKMDIVGYFNSARWLFHQFSHAADVNPLHKKLQLSIDKSKKVLIETVRFTAEAPEAEQAPSTANDDDRLNDERWVYWGETLSQELFSKTSARLGATLNEVVVTAIARGLRRYLVDLSLQPGEMPASSGSNEWTLSIGQLCSFWQKPSSHHCHLPVHNDAIITRIETPFEYSLNPMDQLKKTHIKFQNALTKSPLPWTTHISAKWTVNTYPNWALEGVAIATISRTTVLLSNMLFSAHLPPSLKDFGIFPGLGYGLPVSFGVCTVKNQLRLTVSAMKSVIETKEEVIKLENLVRQELVELLQTGRSSNNQ